MEQQERRTVVIGHKNPDTDSICSAISYASLKKAVSGGRYVPGRAGSISRETKFVLDYFGMPEPELIRDVRTQVKDIEIRKTAGVNRNISLKKAWNIMQETGAVTLPVLKENGTLEGLIIIGSEDNYFNQGKVLIAAANPDMMEYYIEPHDLVILGNRYESQACAVDIDASCLVICQNAEVPDELIKKAEEQSIVIIRTPHDTFTAARLINQSIPVKYFMTKMPLTTFQLTDYVDDIKDVMTKKKFRDFPILDRHGRFRGFISRRRFLDVSKKKVILVDHNEKSQAVDGIEEAEIVEIVDHHRLGNIETVGPVFFRNQPVGCTATIIYQMYQEAGVKISKTIAGLLCSAIISDTLLFRSPTCTPVDEKTAKKLARIAEIDLEQLAGEMFRAGSNLQGKSAEEICFQDFKQFTVNDVVFGVGQINSMNKEELAEIREKLTPHLPKVLKAHNLQMIYFMLTDILDESTELLCCGAGARERVLEAFDLREDTDPIILKGVVSRKKQLIPTLVSFMQQ